MKFLDDHKDKEEVAIELTSLIDVMFMLVLFFMVTTTFATAPGFKVNLPTSSAADIVRDKQDLTIVMRMDDSYVVNQKHVTESQLMDRFYEEGQTHPDTLVIIQADRDISHGKVVKVMDFARQAGLHRLAIATDPPKD